MTVPIRGAVPGAGSAWGRSFLPNLLDRPGSRGRRRRSTSSRSPAPSSGSTRRRDTGSSSPTTALPDVLLHVTCLRRDGFQTAYEGARIVVEAVNRPKGLQAFRVLSMDDYDRRSVRRRRCRRAPMSTSRRPAGSSASTVKWFNRIRGYGFLTRGDGTEDIFVHMETLRRYGITELRPGQVGAGALRRRAEGSDGGRDPARRSRQRPDLALADGGQAASISNRYQ